MTRSRFPVLALLIAAAFCFLCCPGSNAASPAAYRAYSLGPAISVAAVTADGKVFGTVSTGPGAQSAAYLSAAAPATLVQTGYAWSEAASAAGTWEAVNAQASPGKTFGLRRSNGGAWSKLQAASGHTAAKALKIDIDGTVYGWTFGKVSGKSTYCAAVWKPGSGAPQIVSTAGAEAIGAAPGGILVRVRKTTAASAGSLVVIASDGTATTISSGDVVGVVAVGGSAVGAVLVGDDLRPFLWSGGAQTILTPPPVGQSAVALTRAGSAVYGYRTSLGVQYACSWDQASGGALVDLPSPPGLALRTVATVGAGGELAGMGNNAQGEIVAWIGVPG